MKETTDGEHGRLGTGNVWPKRLTSTHDARYGRGAPKGYEPPRHSTVGLQFSGQNGFRLTDLLNPFIPAAPFSGLTSQIRRDLPPKPGRLQYSISLEYQ